MKKAFVVASFFFVLSAVAHPCTFASGYFHQVTKLKGEVVGRSLGLFQFRWLRQRYVVERAELVLFDYVGYRLPAERGREIARSTADASGRFDFGDLPVGHYTIRVAGSGMRDQFDVEVVALDKRTSKVIIDISPISPDCSGGHGFDVYSEN